MPLIPMPKDEVSNCKGHYGRRVLNDDIVRWLRENTTEFWIWDAAEYANSASFYFSSENDALLFKLRWG